MSAKKDYKKMAAAGLRNLYLQIADFYTESIKSGLEVNANILEYFDVRTDSGQPDYSLSLSKSETEIINFVEENIAAQQDETFNTIDSTVSFLISQYDFFSITPPPEGFLQIDYDVKEWWKFRTRLQNGYFIFTEVFNYEDGNIRKTGFNNGNGFAFDPKSANVAITPGSVLATYLINKTKEAYVDYANQNAFSKIVAPEQMLESYFFFLDEGKNSLKFVTDANGKTGKVYIRTFFNEFGQKLTSSLIEIQGVDELKKIPGGIRKNYVVSSLLAAIDAYEKEELKYGPPIPKTQEIIVGFKEVKRLFNQMIKSRLISKSTTVGLVFTEDYEFLAFLDSENTSLNNFKLYRFLKDKKDLNKEIVRLNYYACKFVGRDSGSQPIAVGNSSDNYQHFVATNASYKNDTPEKKAANFKASRSALQFVGDAALRIIFDELRKYVPSGVYEIYEAFLNRVDVRKLAEIFASTQSAKLTIPDLRKVYFRVFLESLDITEMIDCVVENAGTPQSKKEIIYPPALDEDGLPNENTDPITVTSQSNRDFELDLKTILYGKFSYFYNIAKSFDPELFNFPSSDPQESGLPSVGNLVQSLQQATELVATRRQELNALQTQLNSVEDELEAEESGDLEKQFELAEQIESLESQVADAEALVAGAEQQLLDSQSNLRPFINKNFMYILMIPPSQRTRIYNVITSNDPQYKYKSDLINAGILETRDSPGFTPELFIPILFRNEILKYANSLAAVQFQDLYDNIAKENKTLKTSAELKKDQESGSINKSAKTKLTKSPPRITFPVFNTRYSTFSLDALFSDLLQKAFDAAMEQALNPLVGASKSALDKSFNGDEDAWDRLDPDLKAEYTSNDLVQNILDGVLGDFASPLEVYLKARSDVFPANTVEEIKCLFNKIHSDIPIQLQLKLLSNTLDEDDTSIVIVKDAFLECGLNNDFTTITDFFVWLRDLLGSTGGLDILLQKIEDARQASLINTDLCDDNFEFLDSLLASNDSREAIDALTNVLGLLNENQRNALMPNVFGCADNTGKQSIFPDFYNEATRDSLNKHVDRTVSGINRVFDDDISKFKSIILKQNKNNNELLTDLFGADEKAQQATLQDFFANVNKMLDPDAEDVSQTVISQYEAQQTNIESILIDVFSMSSPELIISNQDAPGLTIYRFSFSNSYIYEIVTNTETPSLQYLDQTIDGNSTYIVFSKLNDDEVDVLLTQKLSGGPYDILALYESFLNGQNPLPFANNKNEILIIDYPDISESDAEDFYSQRLLDFLYGNTKEEPDFTKGNLQLLEAILDSILLNFIQDSTLFDNNNFSNIPLKSSARAISDGGILLSDEVFKNYKDLRKTYQCFLNFESKPDANQASNLKALYKLLLNCLVVEGLMKQFFTLGQEQLSLSNNDIVKQAVLVGIGDAFRLSTTKIGNLQTDYTKDIDFLYKLEILERKQTAQQNNLTETDQPDEWKYTDISDKIRFLAEEYYDKIIERLKNRINFAVPNFEAPINLGQITNVVNKTPEGNLAFPIYDSVDESDGRAVPILNGLKKGLILQNYIDVRQNGSIIKQFANGDLANSISPYTDDYKMALDLYINYLPAQNDGGFSQYFDYALYASNIATVGYTNLFFTAQINNLTPFASTAAPRISNAIFPLQAGDIDVKIPYEPVSADFPNSQWFNSFYKTQGKISQDSFTDFYSKSIGFSSDTGEISEQRSYLDKNGPAVYYKKAAAGTRLCLVIAAEQNLNLKTLYSSLAGSGADVKTREIYKEKFGLYKNELDEEFIVIPLIVDETDYLQDQQSLWAGQKAINDAGVLDPQPLPEWWSNLYNNLKGHNFNTNESNVLANFNNLYPVTNSFAQALPITVQSLVDSEYGDQLSTMFDLTKEEILKAINILKAVIDGQWDLNVDDMLTPGMDMYATLAFSLIPVLIKLLATFVDPTWNTPWFLPGPLNPVGFAAKILDAAD